MLCYQKVALQSATGPSQRRTQPNKGKDAPPLLKFGCNVIVKKRISNNRKVKGFEKIGQVGKYLGPLRNSHDGHFVLLEDQKVLKTTRIVPYDLQEQESEERDLEELGWTWMTDPEGRTFYLNKNTGEKSWDTPMRCKEIEEQPEIPELSLIHI